jgi:NitT/TauT family transport system substrate-binding protein
MRAFTMHSLRSAGAALLCAALVSPALAEQEVKIGIGFGVAFLPTYLMDEFKLVEKHAKAAGLDVKTTYHRFSGSGPMQDAVLSGAVDMGPYGTSALLIAWEKARGTPQQTFAISGVTTVPMVLLTNRPNVKKLADLTANDRVSMPSLVSPQAFLLQMQSVKEFGEGQQDKLKQQIVSLPHPDSVSQLISGSTELTAYFAPPPFIQVALKSPKVAKVMSSDEIIGGKASFLIMGATKKWIEANPKLPDVIVKAVDDAAAFIRNEPRKAAEIYLAREPSKFVDLDAVEAILKEYRDEFGSAVHGVQVNADFMGKLGQLKSPPKSWKEIVTPSIANSPSS